jgi:LuxR family maltose regulon positive regulatory protein
LIDASPVDQVLTFLVEHLPPQVHLVITTRQDPALPLARLRARNQLTEIRATDLRFTSIEAAKFLNEVMGLNTSSEDASMLEARTEGWIAGLQLAALSMQGDEDIHRLITSFSGAHHFVLDYLLEEVLQRQSENIQMFLLKTSILNRLCGPLCETVLHDDSIVGQQTLEYLERANLFIIALDNERHWYRYHHLFGDLLRQRLGQSLTPEEIVKSHIRASEWHEKNGNESEAFHHSIAARDFGRAATLAETAWQDMNGNFQSAAWLEWVKQLPEELIRSRPVLCVQIASAFTDMGEIEASESRLRDAERCLKEPSPEIVIVKEEQFQTLPARIAFTRTYNAQIQGDYSTAVQYAEQALKLTPEEEQFMRAQTMAVLGSAHWGNGQLDAASKAMRDWMENAQKAGNFAFAIASASGLADILIARGYLHEAIQAYQQSLQLASSHDNEAQWVIAHHYLGLAMLYHEMGDDNLTEQYFQKSLVTGQQSTLVDWPYRQHIAQARLKESEGDLEAALNFLDEAKRSYIRTPIPNTHPVEALKVRVYLKQGWLSKAQEWVYENKLSVHDQLSFLREFEHITLARVLIAEYQHDRDEHSIRNALDLLERLLSPAEAASRNGSTIGILLAQTLAFHTQENAPQALVSLKRALTLAAPENYFRLFVDEGKVMSELLAELSDSLERESLAVSEVDRLKVYVHKLLSAFEKPSNIHPSSSIQPLIDPLSSRELEVLRLIAQGLSNNEISRKLFLSLSTVKGHNLRIFAKLQAKSRTEAVARARELGLL